MSERVFERANQRDGSSLTGATVDSDAPGASHDVMEHQ
jgi:hypothetical protein